MPTKKKAGGRKSDKDKDADRAELEMLRKKVEEQRQALEAEEARKEKENQGKPQASSRRQRTLVRWDSKSSFRFSDLQSVSSFCLENPAGSCQTREPPRTDTTAVTRTCIHVENL
jgi:hypothetical protein